MQSFEKISKKSSLKSIAFTNLLVHMLKFRVKILKVVVALQTAHKATANIFPIVGMTSVSKVIKKLCVFQKS